MMRRILVIAVVAPVLLFGAVGAAWAGEFTRDFSFETDDLKVVNMIGAVEVTAAQGDAFEIQVMVRGADASEEFLEFVTLEDDGAVLAVRFPVKQYRKYVYPELGSGSKTTIHYRNEREHGKSWLRKIFSGMHGTQVTVRGQGSGKEVWADMTIAVPRGASLEVRHGVGAIEARDVEADLNLDINAGGIQAHDVHGDLRADTGSGHVEATNITGDVNIDTGSGHVEVSECEGTDIKVDTGSGHVVATGLKCRYLNVDTGSGSVKARRVETDRAKIDTGSGSVLLQLDRMGDGSFVIDTGSGGIELVMPDNASARISADTGSGSVSNDYPGADVMKKDRGEMELVVGDGATRVRLDAGSGSIRIKAD